MDLARLRALKTPAQVQDFLDTLAINHEKRGETCMSPLRVLATRKAHCLEGALLAAAAFSLAKKPALLMNLKSSPGDQDHAVALYKVNGYWGAVSKTNHAALRFRDPVYRTLRELALSYFHEYFDNTSGRKTLLAYSRPLNLARFDGWMSALEDVWDIAHALRDQPHTKLVPLKNKRYIRKADAMERAAGKLIEWEKRHPRT